VVTIRNERGKTMTRQTFRKPDGIPFRIGDREAPEMPVHYDGAENVTSPRQFPCGEQMPADHTGTLADVTCEGCKQTPLYKVAVAISNGREPAEDDLAFGP
jgi:hypothetical protein